MAKSTSNKKLSQKGPVGSLLSFVVSNKALLVILTLSFLLRVLSIGSESLWLDESESAKATQQSYSYIISQTYTSILFPEHFRYAQGGAMPLYFITLKAWSSLFGTSEEALRLLSALLGTLSILLIYLLAKKFFDEKTALLASLLAGVSYHLIYYSQEARPYALLLFLSLLSFYSYSLLITAQKNRRTTSLAALYVFSTALALYTHYFALFIPLTQGIHFLLHLAFQKSFRKHIALLFSSFAAIIILYLPWLPSLLGFLSSSQARATADPITLRTLIEFIISLNTFFTPDALTRSALLAGDFSSISLYGIITLSCIVLLSLLLISLFKWSSWISLLTALKKHPFSQNESLLLLWFALPISITLLFSIIFPDSSAFGPIRYLLFVIPAYLIIIAKGVANLRKTLQRTALIAIIILSLLPLHSYYTQLDKPNYREAAAYLEQELGPKDALIVHGASVVLPLSYYATKGTPEPFTSFSLERMQEFAETKKDVWVLYSMERSYDPKGEMRQFMQQRFNLSSQKDFTGVIIIHYTRK